MTDTHIMYERNKNQHKILDKVVYISYPTPSHTQQWFQNCLFFAHFSANNSPLFSYWLLGGFAGNTIPSSFVTKRKVRWSEETYRTWIKSLRFLFRVFLSVNYTRMRVSQRHLDHLIQFVYRFVSKTLTKWFVVLSICWH